MSRKQQLIALLERQYYEQHPEQAIRDSVETQSMLPLLDKLVNGLQFVTPKLGVDYFTETDKSMFYSALYQALHDALRAEIKDGAKGEQGDKGNRGERGMDGQNGKTPVRGVDYMTMNDLNMLAERAAALIPKMKEFEMPDIGSAIAPHIEEIKKNLPNNDSILVSILKDPRLRMLLHGGGGTTTGSSANFTENEVVTGNGTAWTLGAIPVAGSLKLYALGQRLKLTTDYTIVGAAITTVSSWNTGELLADYRTV